MRPLVYLAGGVAGVLGLAGCGLNDNGGAVPDVVIDMQAASAGEPLFNGDAAADFLRVVDFNKSDDELKDGVDGDVLFELPDREDLSSRRWSISVPSSTLWNSTQCEAVAADAGCASISWVAERNGVDVTGDAVMNFDGQGGPYIRASYFCDVVLAAGGTCRQY